MSFVSTNNKSGMGGLTTTTPPITGESGGVTADSVAGSVADAAEAAVEQAAGSLFGALPEPSGLVKAAVAAAQAAAAAGMAQDAVSAIVSAVAGGPGAHNVTVSGSAVPPGALLFASLDGGETLSELFSYVVQLKTPDTLNLGYVSPAANLPLKPMVGKDLCVNIELDGGGKRHISGLVTAARVVGHEGRSVTYELRMEPWVKLLTHTSDYKAFQNKTVVDILDEVLAEYPYPVEKRLVESYPVRTWQVQYGETDFDFLQRLMQEWGIYWWFEHSEDSHTLVLADAISAHKACPDSPLVEWHQEGLKLDKEFIHTITANESLRTGQWVLDDFDFTKPRSLLANTVANPRETGHANYEHYEWPGDYFDKGEGEMLTRIRMEAQRSPGSRVLGAGNIRTLMTGYTFTLMNHPTAELNQEYLLAQTTLFVQDNAQHSGQDQYFTFSTSFELHPTREVYRPQRTISKPHTKGPQSAIVTGPAGQEIWTDQYGRVKVQFGWDRYGKMDENSSCWIRVSYPWAGKGFGMIQIPRIGQEVLVDFKNGDPDLPIIVGRTYNQDTMPPWGLPGMASQSGIFSHSLYGGPTNGNMLRFDDKTGAEEVKFHAEKDLNTTVKNNETHTVMVDRTKTIIKNETNSIGEDRNTTVTKNDGLSVKLAQTINIGTTYRLDVGDQFTLRCGNAALVLHKDGSIEFCGKQLMLHTSDVMQLIGKGIDMNPDGGTAVTADDIAPLPTSE
ncbi:type VI secretion system tip protein VgrG [Salmonella enterica subsp. enterica serovar Derby]|uniref:Type VI secretion system tip protein VgrG n=1 Tax=Salmonella derby TaxID=28144 RepID=A0A5W7ZBV9_SALDE|nr:type VI secretion system Vgr family protein [Salmonella enterica]EDU1643349.1 type VI secretion system tip protein VgrG [Salmonella enterica subsp. enterica serovar Saintpaul]EDV1147394.1 type VI secretion system tip protein VgrG [Salmonella enterica subsp. enterica]EDV5165396.1 type VI secretion system tip protein VgrG [Salmonella enterica subsp. enterica serovar Hato]EED5957607.1 type VI secretion system tip protein VgrG [Salmonella enterica subsp. enterica serovar Agona]EAB7191019.1 type